MSKRSSMTAAVTALCGGAMLLSGCGQNAAPQMMNDAKPGTPASECSGEDFRIDMHPQPDDPGSFLLELRNKSEKSCQPGDWAHLIPVGSKDNRVNVPIDYVETPTPPKDQRLEPGETAYSGVRAELGDPPVVAAGFRATLPKVGGETDVYVDKPSESSSRYPLTHLQIGTLQPTAEGVLF